MIFSYLGQPSCVPQLLSVVQVATLFIVAQIQSFAWFRHIGKHSQSSQLVVSGENTETMTAARANGHMSVKINCRNQLTINQTITKVKQVRKTVWVSGDESHRWIMGPAAANWMSTPKKTKKNNKINSLQSDYLIEVKQLTWIWGLLFPGKSPIDIVCFQNKNISEMFF